MNCKKRSREYELMYTFNCNKNKKIRRNRDRNGDNSDADEDEEIDPSQLRDILRSKMSDIFNRDDERGKNRCNHLYFTEDVTQRSCHALINRIDELNIKLGKLECEYQLESPLKIYLHISSYGGDIFPAFSVIDAMRQSKYPIVTIVEGAVASAATLISVFGQQRYITKHSYMLIHQLTSSCWGKMTEIDDEHENLKDIMDHIYAIYEEKTKLNKTQLRKILKHDRWWSAEHCLKDGLVDKIM